MGRTCESTACPGPKLQIEEVSTERESQREGEGKGETNLPSRRRHAAVEDEGVVAAAGLGIEAFVTPLLRQIRPSPPPSAPLLPAIDCSIPPCAATPWPPSGCLVAPPIDSCGRRPRVL
jgi:hypothetical protein